MVGGAEPTAITGAKPISVQVAPVTYSASAVPIRASGVLARKTEAELAFKIGGVIATVFVRPGDAVKAGQVLAQLQPDEIEAQVAQARSAREKAERDLERAARLEATGASAVEMVQNARTVLEQTGAQVRIAEFNRRYAVIVAPADGRILRRWAEPDELVAAGRPILGFAADADGWIVRAGLAERDVARVRVGDRVTVVAGGHDRPECSGRITQIAEAVEAPTRTTPVEIALDTLPAGARSGFVVALNLFPAEGTERPVVPASALVEGAADRASVFVVAAHSDVARRVPVEVESLHGTQVFLRTPLPREAAVVTKGAEFLRDGTGVTIIK